jgi:hypothetical protein
MLTNLGFECVVRGLRLGKRMARKDWPEGVYVFNDNGTVRHRLPLTLEVDFSVDEYKAMSDDILAQDWTIV